MNPTIFVDNMLEAFDNRIDELSLDTKFRELEEWDSLTALSTVAMIYAEYDVQISGAKLVKCETVGDLMELVRKKK